MTDTPFTAEAVNLAAEAGGWPRLPDELADELALALQEAHAAAWSKVGALMVARNIHGDDLGWHDPLPRALITGAATLVAGNMDDAKVLRGLNDEERLPITWEVIPTDEQRDAIREQARRYSEDPGCPTDDLHRARAYDYAKEWAEEGDDTYAGHVAVDFTYVAGGEYVDPDDEYMDRLGLETTVFGPDGTAICTLAFG